jgi:hypothetical protein
MIEWAYGITTCADRLGTTLERTLHSLEETGFANPRLFIDGAQRLPGEYSGEVTCRWPPITVYANWILGLVELYVRQPRADYFAIFQDDLICCKGLRDYLEAWHPRHSYLNLYTHEQNHDIGRDKSGWFPSNQMGKGALALVFRREAVVDLFESKHIVRRPMDWTVRSTRSIDGAVCEALCRRNDGGVVYIEYVHNPSLVQHADGPSGSVIGNPYGRTAPNFAGEDFDVRRMLPEVRQC